MKKQHKIQWVTKIAAVVLVVFIGTTSIGYAEVARMTKAELKSALDNPDVVVVDVRRGKDWDSSEFKIKGAVRVDPSNFDAWKDQFAKGKTLVLYCA